MTFPLPRALRTLAVCAPLVLTPGCRMLAGLPAEPTLNEVFVVGTLHGGHLEDEVYTLERLEEIIRALDPQLVLVEIPPDRFPLAWDEFVRTGEVTEERVVLYPEFTEVLFPLALEGRLELVPCSAWTRSMSDRRAALLKQWSTTRPADTREVDRARAAASARQEDEGLASDPLGIHTARYDELVDEGMEPYERLFARDLGAGGWTQINLAHHRRVAEALNEISGDGKRVLVVFGAWHKGRLRDLLAERVDIRLRRLPEVLPAESQVP